MIDLALIRRSPEAVRAGLSARNPRYGAALDELLKLDLDNRAAMKEVEDLRAVRNAASQAIGKAKAAKDEAGAQKVMAEVAALKEKMGALEALLSPLSEKTRQAALGLPNLPHESVPVGTSEADNKEVRRGRAPAAYDFKPLDHPTLGENRVLLDFAAVPRLAVSRFRLWSGPGASCIRPIIFFQLDLQP